MESFYFVVILFLMAVFMLAMIYYLGVKTEKMLLSYDIKIGRRNTVLIILMVAVILFALKTVFTGTFIYMTLLFFLCDIIKAVLKLFEKEGKVFKLAEKIYARGFFVVWVSLIITIYGAYNARNPVLKEYNIVIDKEMEKDLNIIMISDIHSGNSTKKKQFDKMLDMVNKEKADVICLCGDIFDESSSTGIIDYAFETFSKMESEYGIYYVAGNHDASFMTDYANDFEKAGITVLKDEEVFIDNKFYLAGRADEIEGERKELNALLDNVNENYPVIVLDHRPENLSQVKKSCADLQLSGHTHNGQIVPGNFFIHLFNDMSYGYKKYKNVNIVVSSGFGTWGVPIRTGSHSEIVKVILQGKN